jgi:bile acid:Na+ symporter, BASS family
VTGSEITIQVLACSALVGLLGAVGLRLTYSEVKAALGRCRLVAILLVNFGVVPAVAAVAARGFGLKRDAAVAMILLAASPFAPVVPIFARMARADLPLAAALTGVFPLASALLTPFVAQAGLRVLANTDAVRFDMWASLTMLLTTISLPLAAGVFVRHRAPNLGRRLLRPVEVISEAIGAASLAFVTATQFRSIINLGWRAWITMSLVSEISLFLGWKVGGTDRTSRQVVALGTSNRNIAFALLVAIESFHGTKIASAVAGNGLLLIALGLLHVGWWRLVNTKRSAA